jgi:hypothetical protein
MAEAMTDDELTEKVAETLDEEEITLADGFADAFLGIGRQFGKPIAVYSRRKCIEVLMRDMDEEQAEEYFEFNLAGAWVGESTPIYLEELE